MALTTQLHPLLTREQLSERFAAKVEKTDGCWLWRGTIDNYGYGRLVSRSTGRAIVMGAHRVSYVLHVGPISDGLQIDHLCRVRDCVNPAHLQAVSIAENIARGETGIHQRAVTHCPKGHPYEGDNLSISQGGRVCIACRRARAKGRYYARKGAAK